MKSRPKEADIIITKNADVLPLSQKEGLIKPFKTWKETDEREGYFPFEHKGLNWWCVLQPYEVGNQTFYIGIVNC